MKLRLFILLAVAFGVLAGCTSAEPEAKTGTGSATPGEKPTRGDK